VWASYDTKIAVDIENNFQSRLTMNNAVLNIAVAQIAPEVGNLEAKLGYDAVEQSRDSLPLIRDMDIDFTLRELKLVSEQHLLEND
jgi:hypothetical protein